MRTAPIRRVKRVFGRIALSKFEKLHKVAVAQLGARRHYAVPRALYVAGILHEFHTDLFMSPSAARCVQFCGRIIGSPSAISRLSGRSADGIPSSYVVSYSWLAVYSRLRNLGVSRIGQSASDWLWLGECFAKNVSKRLRPETQAVYAFTSAARELFLQNKYDGRRSILDQATAPRKQELALVDEEARRFSSWIEREASSVDPGMYHERQLEELELADVILCASGFVKSMVESEGVHPTKTRVVPLGINTNGMKIQATKRRKQGNLRVLFIGDDGLRKGIGYLDQAIRKMPISKITVRVVGNLGFNSSGLSHLAQRMELVGRVPRTEVVKQFEWADVLVLPSVSDTFGLVVLEALKAGLPVVATQNTCAPEIIREGVDGFVVPIRESDILRERLEQLMSNPDLLAEMSHNALERVTEFSLAKYSERLGGIVRDCV